MSAHAAHNDAHDDAHDGPHVTPLPIYFAVFGTLLVLTGVTVWIAQFDFGAANTLIAMLVATIKATLVAAIFMHLLYEERLNTLAFVFGLLFVSLFFIFTMLDVFTRKHIDPARANNGVEASDVLALELEAEAARNETAAPVLIDQAAVPDDERSVAAPPSAPAVVASDGVTVNLGMRAEGRRLLLTGTVASEDVLQTVLTAAKAAVGESNVASRIRVDESVPTPEWIGALSAGYGSIKGVRGLSLEATTSKIIMSGRVDTQAEKDQAGLTLNASVTAIPIDNRIEIKSAGDEALERVKALMAGVDGATYFVENGAEINASAHPTLNSLADMLFEIPAVGVQVGAHTNPRGAESKALSQQRADAIVAYLVKLGVEPRRLKAVGFGPNKAAAGDTNQRVEFSILKQ